jgi:hypothetical protein
MKTLDEVMAEARAAWLHNRVPLKVSGEERWLFKTWWDILEGSQLVPPNFESNGCSLSPDSIRGWIGRYSLWAACHIHDWRYRVGKTWRERLRADAELRRNVVLLLRAQGCTRRAAQTIGWIYWVAVRRFGAPHFGLARYLHEGHDADG